MKRVKPFVAAISVFAFGASLLSGAAFAQTANTTKTASAPTADSSQQLNPQVLQYALNGYHWAVTHGDVHNKKVITVVDFTVPTNQPRLWVIDAKTHKVLMHLLVSNGKHSGLYHTTQFSNKFNSLESSLGVYTTAYTFRGDHGYSLKIKGLEQGINNNAFRRTVEIHRAWYATPAFAKAHGYLGRSYGCFAVNPAKADKLINLIKGGSVLFAYAPQESHDPVVA